MSKFWSFFKVRATESAASSVGVELSLAASALRDGKFEEALELCSEFIARNTTTAEAYDKRAKALLGLGRWDEALQNYDRAVALSPLDFLVNSDRGSVLRKLKRFDEALISYDRAILLKGDSPEAYFYRGNILFELRRYEDAVASYDKAIECTPAGLLPYVAYSSRGLALHHLGRLDEALGSYQHSRSLKSDYTNACVGAGDVLLDLSRHEEAIGCYDKAIESGALDARVFRSRGLALRQLRRLDECLTSYQRAIDLNSGYAEIHIDRANVLLELGRTEEALASYDKAIERLPQSIDALQGRGFALLHLARPEAAIAAFDQALAIDPEHKYLRGLRRHLQMQICDWEDLEDDLKDLAEGLKSGNALSTPFPMLSLIDSPSLHRCAAKLWSEQMFPQDDSLGSIPKRTASDRIHIAYFSPDFRNHPVSLLTAELFETHDRSRFEVTAFAFGPKSNDAMRKRLERAFDRFIVVEEKSDLEVASLARKMGVDIAVDLAGFTEYARTGIFALRASAVQVSYIGYLGTMAAPYMDYLLADATIIPIANQQDYSEKIIYLPTYQVNDSGRRIPNRVPTRQEFHVPHDAFVFACFNANYKVLPAVFSAWMRILNRVPGSVMFLYAGNSLAERNLRREVAQHGIEPRRVVFGEKLEYEEYLARYRVVDLFLDTLPYNGGTTASDALWAGVPVLTCIGRAFAGRVAASLLMGVNLPELITDSMESYEELAVKLATTPDLLATIRAKLQHNRHSAPLFNTVQFTRSLESSYLTVLERRDMGRPPDHVYAIAAPADASQTRD
jgi:predicted O-linked N-acetylglucosamine transferase (SPINDLY family)